MIFAKNTSLYLSVVSLPNFGIVHGDECLIQKVKRIACAFLEMPLFYIMMGRDESSIYIYFVRYKIRSHPFWTTNASPTPLKKLSRNRPGGDCVVVEPGMAPGIFRRGLTLPTRG